MLRRFFLAACAAVTARLAVAQTPAAPGGPPAKLLVLDESGRIGQEPFIFASWLIQDEADMRKRIASMKTASKYRRRLSYTSRDRFKKPLAQRVLQNFVSGSGASTRLVAFEPRPEFKDRALEERYVNFLVSEVQAATAGTDRFHLICQRRFSGAMNERVRSNLLARVPGLQSVTYRSEREEVLIQCLGILTGSARSFTVRKGGTGASKSRAPTNTTKLSLQAYLEQEARMTFPWKVLRTRSLQIATRTET